MFEGAFLVAVFFNCVEHVGVEVGPFLKGKFAAEAPGRNVACQHAGFYCYGSRAAHGVDKVAIAFPTGKHYQPGGEYFVHRCVHGSRAPATLVQALARGVERKGTVIVGDMYVESYSGICYADIRALACLFAKVVDNGVLHLVGHELGVSEIFGVHHRIDGKRGFKVEH